LGLSPAQLVGPAQPNPPNIILYIIMYLYYLYIFIDIKKIKKNYEKSLKHLLIFLHIFIKIV
jgi:energy-coupling factor transporter transmembrane protein EcfT